MYYQSSRFRTNVIPRVNAVTEHGAVVALMMLNKPEVVKMSVSIVGLS